MPTGANRKVAIDTSVAVPLLVQTHTAHKLVVAWWRRRPLALSGHALIETYAVLTRLPGDIRLEPADAARLLHERFESPLLLRPVDSKRVPETLARLNIAGGAAYDAIVALAAVTNHRSLATRDARARSTYEAVGAEVEVVA
ncbi:MAG TPA: PIN domain-containing protein [Jatrophihabitantaceae bacterium]|jgi:predicted nucleic acid-binding protein